MKVFISYNHKDSETAQKMKDVLSAAGHEIVIDVDKMRSGEDIRQFILNCIKECGVTLSLVSTNSLMSAWVALETITSSASASLSQQVFIPCYIDGSFFDRSFVNTTMEKIEAQITEIDTLRKDAMERKWDTIDLDTERSRIMQLHGNLSAIVDRLRNTKCVDLTPEHFDTGMQEIVATLQTSGNGVAQPASAKEIVAAAMTDFNATISGIQDSVMKRKLQGISKQIDMNQQLLDSYEELLRTEKDPKAKMGYQREIDGISKSIDDDMGKLKALTPVTA